MYGWLLPKSSNAYKEQNMKKQEIREAAWSLWQEVAVFIELLDDYLLDEHRSKHETDNYDEEPMHLTSDDIPF